MSYSDLRSRVERLLSGDIREQDFQRLFFNMREESGGTGVVSEVTNFLAHPLRTQAIAAKDSRDLFAFIRFLMPMDRGHIISPVFPATMPNAMRANLRRMRPGTLKRFARTNPIHAKRVLERILARLLPTGHGGYRKVIFLNEEEKRIFSVIAQHIKGGALFTDSDLLKDFARILVRQGLLKESERPSLSIIKPALALFALSAMHNRKIELDDKSVANVAIAPDMYGNLGTFAFGAVLADIDGGGPTTMGAWIFQTDLAISNHCEAGVAPPGRAAFVGAFEMTPELKLKRLAPSGF
jgi:hypothetical protein